MFLWLKSHILGSIFKYTHKFNIEGQMKVIFPIGLINNSIIRFTEGVSKIFAFLGHIEKERIALLYATIID